MVVEWLCPGLRPTRSNRPRLLHCKVILLDEHELLQDVLVSSGLGMINDDRLRADLFPFAAVLSSFPTLTVSLQRRRRLRYRLHRGCAIRKSLVRMKVCAVTYPILVIRARSQVVI